MIESNLTKYTQDEMRIELIPSYGSSIQQKVADISDIIFGIQQERIRDEAISMLKMAAEQLKICSLSEYKNKLGKISLSRILDRADDADREAERISESLWHSYIGLCKENALLDTLKNMLEDCTVGLEKASEELKLHIGDIGSDKANKYYTELAWKKVQDLQLSVTVAAHSASLITEMMTNNIILSERINSLQVNTLVLWRSNISALKAAPDARNLDQVCGVENAILAAISSIVI